MSLKRGTGLSVLARSRDDQRALTRRQMRGCGLASAAREPAYHASEAQRRLYRSSRQEAP